MWICTIDRDELIRIVQGEPVAYAHLERAETLMELGALHNDMTAVWNTEPSPSVLPNLLLIPTKEKRDFFAWAGSYLKIKPVTALVRILDYDTVRTISPTPPTNDRWLRAFIGLILAEALTYLDESTAKQSLRACEGTFSFAAARALLRLQLPNGVRQTGLNWFRTREALGNRTAKLSSNQLQQVWSVVLQLVSPDSESVKSPEAVVRSLKALLQFGDISDTDWQALTENLPALGPRRLMQGTREERVKILDEVIRLLPRSVDSERVAFLVGYLVSMVAPGTLDHWHLLNPVKQVLPTAGLWYGLCAGLRPETRVESQGTGLGRLVGRELQRNVDLLDRPACDISTDELEVVGTSFKPEAASSVEVEISPGISVPFRSLGQRETEFHLKPTPSKPTGQSLDPRVLDSLDNAFEALEEVRRAVERNLAVSDASLFPKPRKKRSVR